MAIYQSLKDFAEARQKAVADGLESPELAALLVEKFAEGVGSTGRDVTAEANAYCEQIDPNHRENRRLRYRAVAKLDLSELRKE